MQVKDAITLAIAVWGAGLSTYNLYQNARRDRRNLLVRMTTVMATLGREIGPPMVNIEVVNTGHRPMEVGAPTLRLPDGRHLALIGAHGIRAFPVRLQDGEKAAIQMEYKDVARGVIEAGHQTVVRLDPICTDTTGRTFIGKGWEVNPREWLRM